MPRRIELDLVDTVAEAIVGDQPRLVALGPAAVGDRRLAAGHDPGLAHRFQAPTAALALERLAQRQVALQQVNRLERRRLVEHLASGVGDFDRGHGGLPSSGRCESRFTP